MEEDKWIYVCNNEGCSVNFMYLYVRQDVNIEAVPECPLCKKVMDYIETVDHIEHKGGEHP